MIKHNPTIPFTEAERREIILNMDYHSVYKMASQFMGSRMSDKNLFLAQACNYHAQVRRLKLDIERGMNDPKAPAPFKSGARNGAHHVRTMTRVLNRMARCLIQKGRTR